MTRLLLLDTSHFGITGSMSRYADLVVQALEVQPGFHTNFALQILRLSLPSCIAKWLPNGASLWLGHFWILLTARFRIRRLSPDVLHLLDGSYGYVVDGMSKCALTTATVHDLIPLLQQHDYFGSMRPSLPARWISRKSVHGLRRCRHLIAVSGNTLRDFVQLGGIDQSRISVVPVALVPGFAAEARVVARPTTSAPGAKPVVLHVGHNGSYKNREGVIRIFSRLRAHCEAKLVMAGPSPTPDLRKLVNSLQLGGDVQFIENPDDTQLVQQYRRASVFLFPSLYEGFGWPPLEAMACGCPVVCSTAASLPEVVGDAALMAAVDNEAELARLCEMVLSDHGLAESLIAKGRQRAGEFTMQSMGAQLLSVYRDLLEQSTESNRENASL